MYNWSVDTSRLKNNQRQMVKFKLEQLINFGLNGEKISRKDLMEYWEFLDLDSARKSFLAGLLWP